MHAAARKFRVDLSTSRVLQTIHGSQAGAWVFELGQEKLGANVRLHQQLGRVHLDSTPAGAELASKIFFPVVLYASA
jgi:hypothetical protein